MICAHAVIASIILMIIIIILVIVLFFFCNLTAVVFDVIFFCNPVRGSCNMCTHSYYYCIWCYYYFSAHFEAAGTCAEQPAAFGFAIQLLMCPEWLMWSDPYSRLYQRDHNSLWENLWIWMVFSAAWWIIEAVLCKTTHSVCVVGVRGQERAALGLLRS